MSEPFVFTDTRPCGCRVDVSWNEPDDGPPYTLYVVPYTCPLHAAAPKLLRALEPLARVAGSLGDIPEHWAWEKRFAWHETDDDGEDTLTLAELIAAREAIREACPERTERLVP